MLKNIVPPSIRKYIKLWRYSGTTYHCPMCGYDSKELFPIGRDLPVLEEKDVVGSQRRAAGCHSCSSTDRERLVYIFLKEKLNIFENKGLRILHFAPEKALTKALADSNFEAYICGDLFTEGYFYPGHVQNMNVLDIPFKDEHFDLIICNHLLEHVPADIDAMKELFRVLKPSGSAILQVPLSLNSEKTTEDPTITQPEDRERFFGQFDHVRIYGQDYFTRLESVGFKIKKCHLYPDFPNYGLSKKEYIIEARK